MGWKVRTAGVKSRKNRNDNGRKSNGGNGTSYTGCGTECSGYISGSWYAFSYKIGGRIICQGEEKIMPDQLDQMITRIYEIAKNRSMERVLSHGDDDFPLPFPECPGSGRMFSAREVPWQQ